MNIVLNGQQNEIPDNVSVKELLDIKKIVPAQVVIEINRQIISRNAFDSTAIKAGDEVEILRFVGGG